MQIVGANEPGHGQLNCRDSSRPKSKPGARREYKNYSARRTPMDAHRPALSFQVSETPCLRKKRKRYEEEQAQIRHVRQGFILDCYYLLPTFTGRHFFEKKKVREVTC